MEEKGSGQEPGGYNRYYSAQRPVNIGVSPDPKDNPLVEVANYEDDRQQAVAWRKIHAWGKVIYKKPLTGKQIRDYEPTPALDNPNRKQSITARLKEGAAKGQKPKERRKGRELER